VVRLGDCCVSDGAMARTACSTSDQCAPTVKPSTNDVFLADALEKVWLSRHPCTDPAQPIIYRSASDLALLAAVAELALRLNDPASAMIQSRKIWFLGRSAALSGHTSQ
jgi:hypothetical protein